MKRYLLPLTFLASALALSGCTTMNEGECQTADWSSVGYQDGAKGRPTTQLGRHTEACAQHGITPDQASYLLGWDEGVLRYCTRHNGYYTGSRGGSYAGVCPADVAEEFLVAYSDGRQLYSLRSEANEIGQEISRHQRRIHEIHEEVEELQHKLRSTDLDRAKRRHIRSKIHELVDEEEHLEHDISDLQYEHGRADAAYEHYRSEMQYEYGQ